MGAGADGKEDQTSNNNDQQGGDLESESEKSFNQNIPQSKNLLNTFVTVATS